MSGGVRWEPMDAEQRRAAIVALLQDDHDRHWARQSASPAAQLGFAASTVAPVAFAHGQSGCQAYAATAKTRRSPRFVFLREIGGPSCLAAYLQSPLLLSQLPRNVTIVIDQPCPVREPLILPSGVTLRGCSLYGNSRLELDVPGAAFAIETRLASRGVVLEDLEITRLGGSSRCVLLRGSGHRVRHVRFSGVWDWAIQGAFASSILIDHAQVIGNSGGVRAVGGTHWHIRNCHIRDAPYWAIDLVGSDAAVVEAGRFESNGKPGLPLHARGAVQTDARATLVAGNYFEQNGWLSPVPGTAVRLAAAARGARILYNMMAADVMVFDQEAVVGAQVASPPPYPYNVNASGWVPLQGFVDSITIGRHSFAFNVDDDWGGNFYAARGLATSSIATVTTLP
ncbi:MAG: right-handed parallel beta-helix repeat-containing protein [Nannocystaceae bacterium]|nr:right-handed parallel beta-helix repeat-containing protein [Nannocystaceae bacterium]